MVAGCLLTKRERGRVRYNYWVNIHSSIYFWYKRAKFGSDILVVHLVMTEDDVTQRLDGRHNNDKVKDILMVRQKTLKNNFLM